jgi:hypothetical protein
MTRNFNRIKNRVNEFLFRISTTKEQINLLLLNQNVLQVMLLSNSPCNLLTDIITYGIYLPGVVAAVYTQDHQIEHDGISQQNF